eukprot:403331082
MYSHKYEQNINKSSKLVQLIKNQERFEELLVKVTFYLFIATSAYMFLKRFYLHELIGLALWILSYLVNGFMSGINIVLELLNMNAVDLFMDFECCKDTASPRLFTHITYDI